MHATYCYFYWDCNTPFNVISQPNKALDRINEITKGLGATESDIYLDLPEIAENGNQVKVSLKWIAL